jgi:hypothetical protein
VHDDLLALKRGVQVRDDAYAPRLADRERLGWRHVLAAGAERTVVELCLRRFLHERPTDTRPLGSTGCDHDLPTRQRVDAELAAQVP